MSSKHASTTMTPRKRMAKAISAACGPRAAAVSVVIAALKLRPELLGEQHLRAFGHDLGVGGKIAYDIAAGGRGNFAIDLVAHEALGRCPDIDPLLALPADDGGIRHQR